MSGGIRAILVVVALWSVHAASAFPVDETDATTNLRATAMEWEIDADSGVSYPRHHNQRRQLWGVGSWSWNNILFHLHVCSEDGCDENAKGPLHPCGCPDCRLPHERKHFAYCRNKSSGGGGGSSSSSSSDGTSYAETYEEVSSTYYDYPEDDSETSRAGGVTNEQRSSRLFNPIALIIGAAVLLAGIVGAIALRRRRKTDVPSGAVSATNYKLATDRTLEARERSSGKRNTYAI